ncbi:MAG: LysR substrate-binding domain-containing protein [Ramlibacter sp.]|jgi:LysR family glycine cleavage system transcriptional activator
MSHLPSLMALRCFDASARLGSFTRAAGEVHLTQGAVSHQVLGLEAQLGVALFLRRRTGLTLTAPGRSYWLEVAAALRQIERATQNMVTHKGQGGAFNLCCASSFASYWLVPRLSGFVAAHPEVTLNLSTHIGPVDFSTSRHDAAIEFCDGPAPGLLAVKVHSLVLRPYAAPALLKGHGRRGAAQLAALLAARPLIRHTTVATAWPGWLAAALPRAGIAPAHLLAGPQYDLLSMALNGAIGGLGVALLPDYMASTATAAGQLVRLSDQGWEPPQAYYLRCPDWKAELVVFQRFREWLLAVADGQKPAA